MPGRRPTVLERHRPRPEPPAGRAERVRVGHAQAVSAAPTFGSRAPIRAASHRPPRRYGSSATRVRRSATVRSGVTFSSAARERLAAVSTSRSRPTPRPDLRAVRFRADPPLAPYVRTRGAGRRPLLLTLPSAASRPRLLSPGPMRPRDQRRSRSITYPDEYSILPARSLPGDCGTLSPSTGRCASDFPRAPAPPLNSAARGRHPLAERLSVSGHRWPTRSYHHRHHRRRRNGGGPATRLLRARQPFYRYIAVLLQGSS